MTPTPDPLLEDVRRRLVHSTALPDTAFGCVVDGRGYGIVVRGGLVTAHAGLPLSPAVTITTSENTLRQMLSGLLSPMSAWMSGAFRVTGSLSTARRLGELFAP